MEQNNQLNISGSIRKVYPFRNTPFGIGVASFILEHASTQIELDESREISCRLYCTSIGINETVYAKLKDSKINASGFLAHNSKNQQVFHVKQITFLDKGN